LVEVVWWFVKSRNEVSQTEIETMQTKQTIQTDNMVKSGVKLVNVGCVVYR
jgi:hypothetical protein